MDLLHHYILIIHVLHFDDVITIRVNSMTYSKYVANDNHTPLSLCRSPDLMRQHQPHDTRAGVSNVFNSTDDNKWWDPGGWSFIMKCLSREGKRYNRSLSVQEVGEIINE